MENFNNIKKDIARIIRAKLNYDHYKIILFGSRVNGNAEPRSDIDIGIQAKEQISLSLFNEIKEELDKLPILQKIDVVDFNIVSDNFKKVALKDCEVIYEQ